MRLEATGLKVTVNMSVDIKIGSYEENKQFDSNESVKEVVKDFAANMSIDAGYEAEKFSGELDLKALVETLGKKVNTEVEKKFEASKKTVSNEESKEEPKTESKESYDIDKAESLDDKSTEELLRMMVDSHDLDEIKRIQTVVVLRIPTYKVPADDGGLLCNKTTYELLCMLAKSHDLDKIDRIKSIILYRASRKNDDDDLQ